MSTIFKTKFEPKLMFVDKATIERMISDKKQAAITANELIPVVKKLLQRDLTDDEMLLVVRDKYPYVVNLLKEDSNFPNADTNTLMSLIGRDPKPVIQAFNNIKGAAFYELSVENSNFYVSEELIQRINDLNTYSTMNEEQNKAFESYSNIAESINTAIDNGLILPHESIKETFRGHLKAAKIKNNLGFVPDHEAIRRKFRTKGE